MGTKITLSESKRFGIECSQDDGDKSLLCRLQGEITEAVDLKPLESYISEHSPQIATIRFDLGSVSRINSYGVRNWLILLRSIPGQIPVEFEFVSEPLMEQACMLPDFLSRDVSRVKSFFAPFFCKKCNTTTRALVSMEEFRRDTSIVDREFRCPDCKAVLQFDGLLDEYEPLLRQVKGGPKRAD